LRVRRSRGSLRAKMPMHMAAAHIIRTTLLLSAACNAAGVHLTGCWASHHRTQSRAAALPIAAARRSNVALMGGGNAQQSADEQPDSSPAISAGVMSHPVLRWPLTQALLCASGYLVHVLFLSKRSLVFLGRSFGYDTLAGLSVLGAAAWQRKRHGEPPVPPWLTSDAASDGTLDLRAAPRAEKLSLVVTSAVTLLLPFAFAYVLAYVQIVSALIQVLVILGLPLTPARCMGAQLLLEQSLLYYLLFRVIGARHRPFFEGKRWVRWSWRSPWLIPTLGGYFASVALFNLVEPINQALLPQLAYAREGFVSKLANPDDRSAASLLLASVAPCVGAPLFEEVQSRAFMLQAISSFAPLRLAIVLSGILFGAQHMQIGLLLPLSVTGAFWAVMYVHSGNLLVPILIHALWNARIFLGSYLGL